MCVSVCMIRDELTTSEYFSQFLTHTQSTIYLYILQSNQYLLSSSTGIFSYFSIVSITFAAPLPFASYFHLFCSEKYFIHVHLLKLFSLTSRFLLMNSYFGQRAHIHSHSLNSGISFLFLFYVFNFQKYEKKLNNLERVRVCVWTFMQRRKYLCDQITKF